MGALKIEVFSYRIEIGEVRCKRIYSTIYSRIVDPRKVFSSPTLCVGKNHDS